LSYRQDSVTKSRQNTGIRAKKTPLGTVWGVPAEFKEARNRPLNTGDCNYQASEEERLYKLLIQLELRRAIA
jgi:hypothetical protein